MFPRRSRLRATELARSAGPANAQLNQIAVIGGRVVATGGSDGQVLYEPASGTFGAYGTVLIVPLDDLPDWLPAWCLDHLGGEPAGVLFQVQQISMVFGLRLAGGTDVVVKARADDGRAASCVAAQAWLAERGFPCPRPLTPATGVGSLAVHAEEFRPGGEVLRGDSPDVAVRYAEVFAWLMAELAGVTVAPPLPNPPWVRWDHTDSGVWPAISFPGNRDQSVVPAYVVDTAQRARGRILAAGLPCVLGHADFEAQNLRWHGQQVQTVHDWDSLAWQPEAALAGAASACAGPTPSISKRAQRTPYTAGTSGPVTAIADNSD